MLFFTRAFLCIGTVVVLAEGVGPADLLRDTRDTAGALAPAALAPLAALCREKPQACLAVAADAVPTEPADRPQHASGAATMRVRPAAARQASGRLPELSSRPRAPR